MARIDSGRHSQCFSIRVIIQFPWKLSRIVSIWIVNMLTMLKIELCKLADSLIWTIVRVEGTVWILHIFFGSVSSWTDIYRILVKYETKNFFKKKGRFPWNYIDTNKFFFPLSKNYKIWKVAAWPYFYHSFHLKRIITFFSIKKFTIPLFIQEIFQF